VLEVRRHLSARLERTNTQGVQFAPSAGIRVWVERCCGRVKVRLRLGEAEFSQVGIDLCISIDVWRHGAKVNLELRWVTSSDCSVFVCARKTNI
jgi:hypothetical protein